MKEKGDFAPDLVIINANIIRVDPANSRAEALGVYGDKIVEVATTHEIKKQITKNTKVIDAQGKTVTPGFIDAHTHPRALYPFENRMHIVDLFYVTSIQDLIQILKAKTAITPPGGWVRGSGYQDTKLGRHPTRDDLDQVSRNHLIQIGHVTMHASAVNSLVLNKAGITEDTPDPWNGGFVRFCGHPVYPDGTTNGVLLEKAGDFVLSRPGIPASPAATKEEEKIGLYTCFQNFIQKGITSIGDAMTDNRKIGLYQDMLQEERLPLRINMMFLIEGSNLDVLEALGKVGVKSGFGSKRLRFGPLKLFAGNSRGARTCWLWEPYVGSHANDKPPYYGIPHPLLWPEPAKIDEMILAGHKAGFQWAVHSIGDREIDRLLDAYQKALKQYPVVDHRHRIEHASIMGKDLRLLNRAKELGVVLNFFPSTYEHGDKYTDYGPERIAHMAPYRSAIDLGIPVAGHSDWDVTAADPMLRIYDMVNRKSKEGIVYGLNQRVTPEEAIRVWTMGGAYASFEEKIKGSIGVGKLADIVILSSDPTAVSPDRIKDIQVEMTIIGGKLAYESKSLV